MLLLYRNIQMKSTRRSRDVSGLRTPSRRERRAERNVRPPFFVVAASALDRGEEAGCRVMIGQSS